MKRISYCVLLDVQQKYCKFYIPTMINSAKEITGRLLALWKFGFSTINKPVRYKVQFLRIITIEILHVRVILND